MLLQNVNNSIYTGESTRSEKSKTSYSVFKFKDVLSEKEKKDKEYDSYQQSYRDFPNSETYNRTGNFDSNSGEAAKDNITKRWPVTEEPKREDYTTKEEYYNALLSYRDYVEDRIENGPEKFQIGAMEMTLEEWEKLLEKVDDAIDAMKESIREDNEKLEEQREKLDIQEDEDLKNLQVKSLLANRMKGDVGAPYSYLADESGIIEYKGVVFVCDNEKKQLCLGDMSNPDDVLNIPLSKGGCLRVNRDNIGDLSKAISMFSPEDINLIMRAIAQDAKVQQMKNEIDDMKSKPVEENAAAKLEE